MMGESEVRELLRPFGLTPTFDEMNRLQAYLELLLRWNSRINLTSVRDARECVTRHFGESLYLARFVRLEGGLLDIGSGAGFPGLALKITFPKLRVTLLEPVGKKRAFLKEVARACEMDLVEVRSEQLGEFVKHQIETGRQRQFDAATSRALARPAALIPEATQCLERGGGLYLWLGDRHREDVFQVSEGLIDWKAPIPIPLAEHREIWCGSRGR